MFSYVHVRGNLIVNSELCSKRSLRQPIMCILSVKKVGGYRTCCHISYANQNGRCRSIIHKFANQSQKASLIMHR